MTDDEITQQTNQSQIASKPEDQIVTSDYSLDTPSEIEPEKELTRIVEFSVLEFL